MSPLPALTALVLLLLATTLGFADDAAKMDVVHFNAATDVVLVIHGGAGVKSKMELENVDLRKKYVEALELALDEGFKAMQKEKGTSLDAVEAAIRVMEDSPLFNAGKGAVFTSDWRNELDASIMVGNNDPQKRQAGAVAAVTIIKNPISAARAVMEKSPHVMMMGRGAERFASEHNIETVDPSYFWTKERWEAIKKAQKEEEEQKNRKKGARTPPLQRYYGTVGAVAVKKGDIAAGTSTGGMTNKRFGRVGDSPIIGAGTFADNATCGVSCTGHGEVFIRHTVAADVVARMKYKELSVLDAAKATIKDLPEEKDGVGGLIALDAKGNAAMVMSAKSDGMYRGYITSKGNKKVVMIFRDEK